MHELFDLRALLAISACNSRHAVRVPQNWARTAMMMAAANGRIDCLRALVDAGADKDAIESVRVGRFCI